MFVRFRGYWRRTYFVGLASVRLRARLPAASELDVDMLLGVLGTMGDAAIPKAHIWRKAARVDVR